VVGSDRSQTQAVVAALEAGGFLAFAARYVDGLLSRRQGAAVVVLCACDGAKAMRKDLRVLRRKRRTARVPIVVVGDARSDRQLYSALLSGADDFADSAADPSELCARVAAQLKSRHLLAELRRQRKAAETVVELTQALSSTVHIRDILFLVVQRIAQVVRIDRVSIVLSGAGEETGYVLAASDDRKLRDLPIRLTDYPEIRTVLDTDEPLLIPDAAKHPLFDVGAGKRPASFRSLTLFPIRFEGRPMGVLFLRNHEPRPLQESEISLLRAVANATGVALRNARLVQALRDESRRSRFAQFEAEQKVKALERYAEFFDASADGIVVVDEAGKVLFCNPAACRITGRSREELHRGVLDTMLVSEDTERFRDVKESFARGVFEGNVDLSIQTPSGRTRVLNVSFKVLPRAQGSIIITFRDVTESRDMERELTRTKEFLQRVIDSSVDAIVSADQSGTVLLFNPAAERIYGHEAAQVVGKMDVRALYPEGEAVEVMRRIRSPEHGPPGRLEGYRTHLLGREGDLIPVALSAALIMHGDEPIGSVGLFTDLRAKLRIEAELAETQQELAAQEKRAVVAELAGATAHELNQPLTAVMGYADLLTRRIEAESPLSTASAAIVRETERMADIVRKIGKLTKYETKPYVGEAKIIDLDRAVGSDPTGTVG
jgi:PAS domain S-box-containing protein